MTTWTIPMQQYRSKTAATRPPSLSDGELFINQADGVLCWPNASGMVQTTPLTTSGSGSSVLTSGATLTGPTLAAGTASVAPYHMTAGVNLTIAAAGANEFDGIVFYATAQAGARQVISAEQFVMLSAAYTLTSTTAAQKLFNASTNGALTLAVGTYKFECAFSLSGMSASTGRFGFALGGTATFTQGWSAEAIKNSSLNGGATASTTYNTVANTAISASNTATTGWARILGTIRVTTAGTLIPQVSLSNAIAATVGANSFFRAWPVGSATVTNVGNWS